MLPARDLPSFSKGAVYDSENEPPSGWGSSRYARFSSSALFITCCFHHLLCPKISFARSNTFAHSCGNTFSCLSCLAAGSNIVHSQSVLL